MDMHVDSHSPLSRLSVAYITSSEPQWLAPGNEPSTYEALAPTSEVLSDARSSYASYTQQDAEVHLSGPLHSVTSLPHQQQGQIASTYPDPLRPLVGAGRPDSFLVSDRRPLYSTKCQGYPHPLHLAELAKPSDYIHSKGVVHSQRPPPLGFVDYKQGQLSPGQRPLLPSSDKASPRDCVASHAPGQYESGPGPGPAHARARYDNRTSKLLESGTHGEGLTTMKSCSQEIIKFLEVYGCIAQGQHGSQPVLGRVPTERELEDWLSHVECLKRCFEQLSGISASSLTHEMAQEDVKPPKGAYEGIQDAVVYKLPRDRTEHKKREVCVPARCHSCGRVDTPEWRRGPDGVRTLYNACGLHYAKLERKRQLEQRNSKPGKRNIRR